MADYDKAAIKRILMERDDDAAEDAGLGEDAGLLGLKSCIESHFGLEPDYLDTFLEN